MRFSLSPCGPLLVNPSMYLLQSTNGMYFPTETLLIGPKLERIAGRHAEEES